MSEEELKSQKKRADLKKILKQVFLFSTIAATLYVGSDLALNFRTPSSAILERVWAQDIQHLLEKEKLPSYWNNIRIIEKIPANDDILAAEWVKSVSPPVKVNPDGKYSLEILFLSQKNEAEEKAVIQHHIIHIPSGNSVWELGRTYQLK